MPDEQLRQINEQLTWLTAAVFNNTVKMVEVECVRNMGRQLSPEEKDLIHHDCLGELSYVRDLLAAHSGSK